MAAHLQGKISWLRYVRGQSDPVFRAIAIRFNANFPHRKIEVTPTPAEVRDRAVWVVEHFDGEMAQGSAFFLKGTGLVTAAHCVESGATLEVYHPSKPANKFNVKVRALDSDRDLAILEHSIPATEYFEFEESTSVVSVGDELFALGYPGFGPGDGLSVRDGKVSSLPTKNAVALIEVTQKLTPGMSGGPLLDSLNRVVGIAHRGGPNEGRDFAVKVEVLREWAGHSANTP